MNKSDQKKGTQGGENKENMKKIAHLIVNKDASLKEISKEIFKLQAIISDTRMSTLSEDYCRLCERFEKARENNAFNCKVLCQSLYHKETDMNQEFIEWSQTPSREALTYDGAVRDEDELNWPTDYLEVSEDRFKALVHEIQECFKNGKGAQVCPKWSLIATQHHKNVLIVMPLYLNGHLDQLIQDLKNKE